MADEYSHINYSVADIERYLNGRMTAKEMHELEKAALGDPFLADAIEGYREADMDQSRRHLDEISALLLKDKSETKVIPIPFKKNSWWRVAASVVLVAGVGTISWFLLRESSSLPQQHIAREKKSSTIALDSNKVAEAKPEPPAIAQNVVPEVQQKREKEAIARKEERASKEAVARKEESARKDRTMVKIAPKPGPKSAKVEVENEVAANTQETYDAKVEPDSNASLSIARTDNRNALNKVAPGIQRAFATPAKKYVFKGKVSDDNHLPVPNATVALENTNAGTVTDMDGNFAIVSKDSTATVSVSSVGYENRNVLLKPDSINTITMSESAASLSETVVMDYLSKKMKKTDSLASPVTGWESFDKYVAEKMKKKYDSTASLSDLNGDVMIEFLVDTKGKPYNFKVLKSLSEDADKKAVEIIKDGPAWTSDKKRKRGKVTIHF